MKINEIELDLDLMKPSHMARYENALEYIRNEAKAAGDRKGEKTSKIMSDDIKKMFEFMRIVAPDTEPEAWGLDADNYDACFDVCEKTIEEANRQLKAKAAKFDRYHNLVK